MHIDADQRIIDFVEKPANPPAMPGDPDSSLASMGIYVFRTEYLIERLRADAADAHSSHDFGKDVIPAIVKGGKAVAHKFSDSCVSSGRFPTPYWRDVGTVDAFWQANIDLTDFEPELDLYDTRWPIWTYGEITPPAKFIHDEADRRGSATSSLVSGGCIISGSQVDQSLLFTNVRCNSYGRLHRVVALPSVDIGRHARLKDVVIDRGVRIPEGLVVGEDPELDARRFRRTESGICLITQPMIDRLGA
jgi:glucose-1-phosphate adenylyltransferase